MSDWNGDGKNDWHDDYVYNEILNTPKSDKSSVNSTNGTNNARTTIIVLIVIAVLWELINVIAHALY